MAKVRKASRKKVSSTDRHLLVSTMEVCEEFDKAKIVEALVREANLGEADAKGIASRVETQIESLLLPEVPVSLVRDFVNIELVRSGLKRKLSSQNVIGTPVWDLENLLYEKSNENSNIAVNNPEAVNLFLAETVLKQYALDRVYSKEVADRHKSGAIHIHDLGMCIRNYCSAHSLLSIAKWGLGGWLENLQSNSKPASYARTLTGHLQTFLASIQAYYAGALGIGFVNVFYAPYVEDLTYKQMKQEAQYLIFSASQNAFSRGSQSVKGTELVYVFDAFENDLKLIPISNLYAKFDFQEKNRYYALSLNQTTGGTELKPIYGAIRHERKNDLVKVSCGNGLSAIVTEDHSLFDIDNKGNINEVNPSVSPTHVLSYRQMDIALPQKKYDLTEFYPEKEDILFDDDFVWFVRFPQKKIKRFIVADEKFAELVGLYVAEGGHTSNSVNIFIFENQKEKEKISKLFLDVFGREGEIHPKMVALSSKVVLSFLTSICGERDYKKKIPTSILFGSTSVAVSFLAGYLSGDGYVSGNRIGCVTVSETLKCHLMLLFSKVGCIARVCKRQPFTKAILGKLLKQPPREQFVISVGVYYFDKLYFTYARKEERRKQLWDKFSNQHESKKYDQLDYDYNYLREKIKQVFRDKISLKCFDISEKQLMDVKDKVETALRMYDGIHEVTRYNIDSVLNFLYLHNNIGCNLPQNPTQMYFYIRGVHSDTMFALGKQIIGNQVKMLRELNELLEKSTHLLPVGVQSIVKEKEQDEFVYDISVRDNENFLLGNGLFAHNSLFLDFNVHSGVPEFLKNVRAIGPGGNETGKTYKDYEETAQKFCRAMLEVWNDGDKDGGPFFFPKCDFHIDKNTFADAKQNELFKYACEVASKNGSTYFIFDRDSEEDGVQIAACCRLRENVTDREMIEHPESMRFVGFQNITINLPHAAFKAKGDLEETISFVEKYMDLAMKAHTQKKKFIESLMKPGLPMWQMAKPFYDGKPYVNLNKATYIIGMLGLNECVKRITGKHLHESDDAYKMGMRILTAMYLKAKKLAKESGLKVSLEESPAESAAYRLAKIDLATFKEAKEYVRGDKEGGAVYYSNSVHFIPDAPISIFQRIEGQSKFHTLIEAGAIVHVFVGEQSPSPKAIASLVKRTWEKTACSQLTFSPTFCSCETCQHTWRSKYHG